ncbi:MAG: hypothetical protein WC648_01125 [Candidatus Paceibacterota bacterium]|jgi:hypothetical protein
MQKIINKILKEYDDYFFEATHGRNDVRREKIISSIKKAVEMAFKEIEVEKEVKIYRKDEQGNTRKLAVAMLKSEGFNSALSLIEKKKSLFLNK